MSKYKPPRGLRDFPPGSMGERRNIVKLIEDLFQDYSFLNWDGPAFEKMTTLKHKAGPDVMKEIYSFKDKGGRKIGLRFELTTSLARIIANNLNLKQPIKTYSIGKVWRYERSQKGRYREFLQADADIFGSKNMGCEAELLLLGGQIMKELGFYNFKIRLNNRKILYAQAKLANISPEKKKDAFRALDKLYKIGYGGVREEFKKRNIPQKSFAKFTKLTTIKGKNRSKLEKMQEFLQNNSQGQQGIEELEIILDLLEDTELDHKIEIDPSLVRGWDYYTGPIFEIEIISEEKVGSVSGGGRYDKLVELFGGRPTPATGISFGIERLIDLIKKDPEKCEKFQVSPPFVQIIYQESFLKKALKVAQNLRRMGIKTTLDLKSKPFTRQLSLAEQKSVKYVIIIGEKEISKNLYTFKDMQSGRQSQYKLDEGINKIIKKDEKI